MDNKEKLMIVAKIFGGLGNQMFQYAMARSLSSDKQLPLLLDTSWYQNVGNATSREFELPHFAFETREAKKKVVDRLTKHRFSRLVKSSERIFKKKISLPPSYIKEPHFHYWSEITSVPESCYLEGYWQSARYFDKNKDIIKGDFTFPEISDSLNLSYYRKIRAEENAVCLHVRRGDYVSNAATNAFHGCCSLEYYEDAIVYLSTLITQPHYFIFSDDPEWALQNFHLEKMTVVTGNSGKNAFRDMQLMTYCKHHILANSSFSWWGAWLKEYQGITIAPDRWFKSEEHKTDDLYLDDWIKI